VNRRKQLFGGAALLALAQLSMVVSCSNDVDPVYGSGGTSGSALDETGGAATSSGGSSQSTTDGTQTGGSSRNPTPAWECPGCGVLVKPFTSCTDFCESLKNRGLGGTGGST
jgi:hypothetical protein